MKKTFYFLFACVCLYIFETYDTEASESIMYITEEGQIKPVSYSTRAESDGVAITYGIPSTGGPVYQNTGMYMRNQPFYSNPVSSDYNNNHGPSEGSDMHAVYVAVEAIGGEVAKPLMAKNENSLSATTGENAGSVEKNTMQGSNINTTGSSTDGLYISNGGSSEYTTFDDDPDDPGGPIDPPADNVPLDGGLSVLLAAGIGIGLSGYRKKKRVTKILLQNLQFI